MEKICCYLFDIVTGGTVCAVILFIIAAAMFIL